MDTGSQTFPPLTFQPAPTYSPQQIMQSAIQPGAEALSNYAAGKTALAQAVLQNAMEYQSKSKLLQQQIAEETEKMNAMERMWGVRAEAQEKGMEKRAIDAEKLRVQQMNDTQKANEVRALQNGTLDPKTGMFIPGVPMQKGESVDDYLSHAYGDQNKVRADMITTQANNSDLLNRALMWNANRVGDAAGRNAVAGLVSGMTGTVPGTHFWNGGTQSWQQFYNSSLASAQTQALKDGKQFSYGAFLTALGNQFPTIFGEAAQKYQDAATTASQQALNTPHPLLMGLAKQNSINPMGLGDLATKYGNDPSKLFSSFTGTPQATLQPKTNTVTTPTAAPTASAPLKGSIPTLWNASGFGANPPTFTPGPTPVVEPAIAAVGGMVGNAAQDATTFFRNLGRAAFTGAPPLSYAPVNPVTLFRQAQAALPPPANAPLTADQLATARATLAARMPPQPTNSVPQVDPTQIMRMINAGSTSPIFPLTGIATPPSVPATASPGFVLTTANN